MRKHLNDFCKSKVEAPIEKLLHYFLTISVWQCHHRAHRPGYLSGGK